MRKNFRSGERKKEFNHLVGKFSKGEITRRDFIKGGISLGFSLSLLTGIADLYSNEAFSQEDVPESLMNKVQEEGNKVNVFNWSFYIDPGRVEKFEKEFGVKVTYDLFESNDQMKAKIMAGGSGYDVVYPSQDTLEEMWRLGLLQPLNHQWTPNMEGLMDKFVDPPFDPGNTFSLAYQWGTTGYSHLMPKTKGDERVGSWALMFEGEKYAGKMAMLNVDTNVIGSALKYLGYSLNTGQPWEEGDEEKLMEAREVLLRQKPWLKAYIYGGPMKKSLISEEIWIGQEWSGDALFVSDENPDFEYVLPKEGDEVWVDSMAIPHDAPHPATAHLWINYMLRPKVQAAITNYVWYPSPIAKAKEYLPKEILENPAVYPPEEALAKCEFYKPYTDKAKEIREQIWEELKG